MKKLLPLAVSCTDLGRDYMADIFESYKWQEFKEHGANGFKLIGLAIEKDLEYALKLPILLIVGERDWLKKINMAWARDQEVDLLIVPKASHNSNMDQADYVNRNIENFILDLILDQG